MEQEDCEHEETVVEDYAERIPYGETFWNPPEHRVVVKYIRRCIKCKAKLPYFKEDE